MKLTIARRLSLLIGSALVGMVVLVSLFLFSERTMVMEERKHGLRQAVEAAHGILVYFQDQVSKGQMPEPEAKLRAMAALKGLRYSGNEYFFLQDMATRY